MTASLFEIYTACVVNTTLCPEDKYKYYFMLDFFLLANEAFHIENNNLWTSTADLI